MQKINLTEKPSRFSAHWSPKVIAELNGQHVKLVKFRGAFVWHRHEHEDMDHQDYWVRDAGSKQGVHATPFILWGKIDLRRHASPVISRP